MQVRAVGKHFRTPPPKARRVAKLVKGRPAQEALNLLQMLPQKPARFMFKLLRQAVSNATQDFELDAENLIVANILVDQGSLRLRKRFRPAARMRSARILKRTSHITVIVDDRGGTEQ